MLAEQAAEFGGHMHGDLLHHVPGEQLAPRPALAGPGHGAVQQREQVLRHRGRVVVPEDPAHQHEHCQPRQPEQEVQNVKKRFQYIYDHLKISETNCNRWQD